MVNSIQLLKGLGVAGDYHAGEYVRHRYLAKKDPTKPNLRQVLLIDTFTLARLASQDIHLEPGMMGENIVVDGIDLTNLQIGVQIEIGDVLLEVTEVRNPCYQLNEMHPRLLKSVVTKVDRQIHRDAGLMARILKGGWVRPGEHVLVREVSNPA
jgi:MOSC domain-containing protein YiiM